MISGNVPNRPLAETLQAQGIRTLVIGDAKYGHRLMRNAVLDGYRVAAELDSSVDRVAYQSVG